MWSDFQLVFQWWGTLFLIGAFAYPLTSALFGKKRQTPDQVGGDSRKDGFASRSFSEGWWDQGYFFSKAVGMAVVAWILYAAGTLHLLPFTVPSIYIALGVVFGVGVLLSWGSKEVKGNWGKTIGIFFIEELFFFGALVLWSWVKAHEPSIHGLEKFMDFGFTQSILSTTFFPAPDMWYAGFTINYYYFGHLVMAMLTKFSGLDLAVTFNLMLATIFAFTATMSFSIGVQLSRSGHVRKIGQILAGFLTAFLVTMAGNMQTIYAFTRGYTGDDVKPFWELAWKFGELGGVGGLWGKIEEGINRYWYANATRFIPYTIHEFPSYSFVVSDVHGHVLSLPFVLLAIALLVKIWGDKGTKGSWGSYIFYGFLCGALLMTNALDGPIYFGLFVVIMGVFFWGSKGFWRNLGKTIGVVLGSMVVASLPFLLHFKSFVSGVAVNCPPFFLENVKIGPILFESVEKCQHSPLWMMWLLWGFFIFCGSMLLVKLGRLGRWGKLGVEERLLVIFFLFSIALIIFPEFFYFKDIYPMHFRSNTMFKLGYDAFILFSIVSAYVISSSFWQASHRARPESDPGQARMTRTIFIVLLIPQLFLVSIFPIFSVRSYFGELKTYKGLDGLVWLKDMYPSDYAGIQWMNSQKNGLPVIVEADGDSYTDYARFSAFTGIPTIIGWPVHEWLWRGSYDVVSPRREEVRTIYETKDVEVAREILKKYNVKYVIVGTLEREKYKNLEEEKFKLFGKLVFQQGETVIYEATP